LSVSDLQKQINKDKGKPEKEVLPEQKEYELLTRNFQLQDDLFAERGRISLVAETLEQDIFPVLAELAESGKQLPPQLLESLEKVRQYVDEQPKTGRSPWSIVRNGSGGYEVMYRLDDLGFMYLHEDRFPDTGLEDLVKRLNAEVK
jgi:hypothetical protein